MGVLALAARVDAAHGGVDVVMNIAGTPTWGDGRLNTHLTAVARSAS